MVQMWVDAASRGRGLGRLLAEAVAEWAGGRGATRLEASVTEGNRPAETLYPKLRDHADLITVGSFAVRGASLEHLIAMKRAAGRTKDLADVEELEAIADLRRRGQ